MDSWDLAENPIAYIRAGDSKDIREQFKSRDCLVQEHPYGYRSVHYLLQTQPTKRAHIAELQVRTIFEEGWSEIDHFVRYRQHANTSDSRLEEFLLLFNRLAGTADEMGTFVGHLRQMLHEHAETEAHLNATIAKLDISEAQKETLRKQVEALSRSSRSTYEYFSQPGPDLGNIWSHVAENRRTP
jgi:putative GTP pyrophosphokinase